MASFSIGEAYGAGFGLVARKPLQVLTWGIVSSALKLLPVLLMLWLVGPDMIKAWGELIANAAANGDPQDGMDSFTQTMSQVQSFEALGWLTSILATAVINAAIFRAMLRPGDGGLMHMKLGMDELWQGLLYLVAGILIAIFAVLVVLASAALGGIVYFIGEAAGSPLGGWIKALGLIATVIACLTTIVWIWLRFSLAGPATFDTRTFQLFESWSLTKGHSWSLLGLALLLLATILAFEVVFGGLLLATFFSLGSLEALSPDSIEAFFAQAPDVWLGQAAPWLIGIGLIGALLSGVVYTILLAPFASVYAQLTQTPQPAA